MIRVAPGVWSNSAEGRAAVVALPGFQGDGRIFAPLGRALSQRLVAFDLPPGGPSEAARRLYGRFGSHIDEPVHVVTGSFGGLVAGGLPQHLFRSFAAVATAPHRGAISAGSRVVGRALGALPGPVVAALYRRRLARRLVADGVPVDVIDQLHVPPAEVVCERMAGVLTWDVPPWPIGRKCWVIGRDDAEARWTDAQIRSHQGEDCEILRVPGGHRPFASHPEALAEALVPWWNRTPGVVSLRSTGRAVPP